MRPTQLLPPPPPPPPPPRQPQAPSTIQLPPEVHAGGPVAVYEGWVKLGQALRDQLERLNDQRDGLMTELREAPAWASQTVVKGLETRIAQVDARITAIDRQLVEVDAAVAMAGTVPGIATTSPPDIFPGERSGPPEARFVVGVMFILCVLLPFSIAYARRIWRRSGDAVSAIPSEIHERLARMDQNIDTIALEIERIGESQRFLTRVYADEQRGLGARPAERVEIGDREKDRQARK